jgi:hypothetical protein
MIETYLSLTHESEFLIAKLVLENQEFLLEQWNEFFGN